MASVAGVSSVEGFDKALTEAHSNLVVVHFWAAWAPQCEQVNDVLSELAKDTQFINSKFVKVEAEEVPEISQRYEVEAVPTCLLLRNKAVIDRVNGANVSELTKKVQQHGAPGAFVPIPAQKPQEDLNTKLKRLIGMAPVMLFMKGSPDTPRCGFSRQTCQILNDQSIEFGSFDILSDEDVRQGLKKYSDWPTYPQLYINNELVGGLDIIKEMVESGDLQSMVPKQESLEDRLKGLIKRDRVMLFMKGDPTTPRCGFSRTIVGILNDTGVKYGTFDILSDEEVRQGLKKFSDWPTYPQLYVNGELVGGLDIIKELQETNELSSTLNEGQ